MTNGSSPAMRVFNKIAKALFTYLRKKSHHSVVYADDTNLEGKTYDECLQNVTDSIKVLQELDFTIHPNKFCVTPKQYMAFLGY